ncbi:MAG: 2-hydroxyacid dehydrogenase [Rhizobiales bacterium 65-9]|nr:2-hydroxyacid dehydrogenase [Hyphomicrobiales bacterium]OJY32944.1 MAG: 2-hydroxyacid dehydrogenase [Rhizobiales bacterium 65-9]
MTNATMPRIVEGVDRAFRLHKLWEAKDREAALAEIAPTIRGVAVGGHTVVDDKFLAQFPKLEIVSSMGVGYDHIDARAAAKRGVIVTNTPGVLDEEVADTCLGLILCAVRRLPQSERYLRAGKWLKGNFPLSPTLRGRTAGILGLGRIGKAIARRLEAFGVEVCYHGRNEQPGVGYVYYPTLLELARNVDLLICVAPGGAETRHLVNAEVLEALGKDGVLINVGRGSVVDERALIEALRKKTILTAGLDVFEDEPRVPQELIDMEDVVLFPHVGSASVHTRDAMAQLVVDNLIDYFSGKAPRTPVPETPWPRAKS